jgi:RpiR family transcriptional regulator, carbohydrate utilization regulator
VADAKVQPRGECLLRIQAGLNGFGAAEKRLADYVLTQPQDAVQCTIEQLQERTGSSYATVNRFCRRLGYSGYKEFRRALIDGVAGAGERTIETTGVPITAGDTVRGISEKIFASSIALLQETRAILDNAALEKAVKALCGAGELYFVGTGTSGLSARYAFTRFFRIGIRCSSESDSTLTRQKAAILTSRDVLFAISSSGRSAGVVEAARIASRHGAKVISLCDYAVSPLSRIADVNLYTTPRNVGHYLDKEMPLIVGQIALIDVLFAGCCVALGRKADVNALYEETKRAADAEKVDSK